MAAAPSASKSDFIAWHIPRTSDGKALQGLAKRYKDLRLAGLQLSPEAFASTFEDESLLPDDFWISQLQNPQLETFVCTVSSAGSLVDQEVQIANNELEWVAIATLRGPLDLIDFTLPPESGQSLLDPACEHNEERWHFLGLYNLPTFRGQGLARKLCQEALQWLATSRLKQRDAIDAVRVRTIIKPDNLASLSLFRKLGFVDSARCTLAEALQANGKIVPEHWDKQDPRRHKSVWGKLRAPFIGHVGFYQDNDQSYTDIKLYFHNQIVASPYMHAVKSVV